MGFSFRKFKKSKLGKSKKVDSTSDESKVNEAKAPTNNKSKRILSVRSSKRKTVEQTSVSKQDKVKVNNENEEIRSRPITPPPEPPKVRKEFEVVPAPDSDDEWECMEVVLSEVQVSSDGSIIPKNTKDGGQNSGDDSDNSKLPASRETEGPEPTTTSETTEVAPVTPEKGNSSDAIPVPSAGDEQGKQETPAAEADAPSTPPVVTPTSATSQTPLHRNTEQEPALVGEEDPAGREGAPVDEKDEKDNVAKKLLDVFVCNQATAEFVVEKIKKQIITSGCDPTPCTDGAPCHETTSTQMAVRNQNIFDENFALKMLNELLNEGFTLIYHEPQPLRGDGVDQNWVGRSATMTLLPGICNALEVEQPQILWKTMGGGNHEIETRSIGLLDIHNIGTSRGEETRDDEEDEIFEDNEDDMNCFFTITTSDGDVHVFESIIPDDSERLVRGVKNLIARFANQVISGDANAIAEFYSNHGESDDIRLTSDEAMVKLSHSFFD